MQYLLLIRLTVRQTGSCVAAAARHSPDNIILEEASASGKKKKKHKLKINREASGQNNSLIKEAKAFQELLKILIVYLFFSTMCVYYYCIYFPLPSKLLSPDSSSLIGGKGFPPTGSVNPSWLILLRTILPLLLSFILTSISHCTIFFIYLFLDEQYFLH